MVEKVQQKQYHLSNDTAMIISKWGDFAMESELYLNDHYVKIITLRKILQNPWILKLSNLDDYKMSNF